ADLVRSHHERHAGSGYPRGLRGPSIPLDARILAVADTLDALTSNRPYRQAIPFSAALDEIANGSGEQFDPQVVRAFFSMPENLWQDMCGLSIQTQLAA